MNSGLLLIVVDLINLFRNMTGISKTIAAYEQAIAANPTVLANYWHLGLAQLLQGDEVDAQATWMSAFMAIEDEAQAAQAAQDLSQILIKGWQLNFAN
jgi:hypothetical protein